MYQPNQTGRPASQKPHANKNKSSAIFIKVIKNGKDDAKERWERNRKWDAAALTFFLEKDKKNLLEPEIRSEKTSSKETNRQL